MPFNWVDYLQLAQTLASNADEASKRSAISRAYYSVFNLAYARVVQNHGQKPQGVGSHEWCWDAYTNNADINCRRIGIAGKRLKRDRVWADYKDHQKLRLHDECNQIILDVRQLHTDLAGLAANQP
jgi:uncharacterized protein (UPF0332 family)